MLRCMTTGNQTGPRIGVALGSGAARGLSHIPFIEAMDELGLKPSIIAGCSMGALIGAGWANGMTGAELREHAYAVLGSFHLIASTIWTRLPTLTGVFKTGLSVQIDPRLIVDAFVPEGFPDDFAALSIPFNAVATDLRAWEEVVIGAGPLRPAIAASIAIPSLFRSVTHEGRIFVDGGATNPLPLDRAAIGSDILVGIDVNGDPADLMTKTNHNALDVWFGSAQIMMHSLTAHMMAAYPPDVYVRPHVMPFGALEFWRVREIIAHVESDKDNFKRALAKKVEAFMAHQDVASMRAEDR